MPEVEVACYTRGDDDDDDGGGGDGNEERTYPFNFLRSLTEAKKPVAAKH